MPSNFEKRRLEFADRLIYLREQAGLALAKDLAARVGWDKTRVSKIERGKQLATDADLTRWLDAVGAPADVAEDMRDELRELRILQSSWRRQLRSGHRARQRQDELDERQAKVIQIVDVFAVPGWLQTPAYARAVFESQADFLDVPRDIDESVSARMQRGQILYEPGRKIDILMTEAALGMPVCSAHDMRVQIDRLMSVAGLPNARFGILPLFVTYPVLVQHGFWIVDDAVSVEHIDREDVLTDPDQVALYQRLAHRLWDVAAEGDEARSILAAASARWAERLKAL